MASKMSGSSADNSKEAKKLQGRKDGKGKSKIANKIIEKSTDVKLIKLREEITTLKTMAKNASLDDIFIPNRLTHLNKWTHETKTTSAFTSDVDE
ncbi:MAG: hypothetical protein MUP82_08320, partial [Candidatus Marinimicrobia bacterium]|nr:hypothetical protein [Candidatus Neomarinimicrobiota bacterium]